MVSANSLLIELSANYLQNFQIETAFFYAERAYYESRDEESVKMLAQCFIRIGKFKQAYMILQSCCKGDNAYLFALCCYHLERYSEAEWALSQGKASDKLDSASGGAAGFCLLGNICKETNRKSLAIKYFRKCLHLDPFCWEAVERLVEMDEAPGISSDFLSSRLQLGADFNAAMPSRKSSDLVPEQENTPWKPSRNQSIVSDEGVGHLGSSISKREQGSAIGQLGTPRATLALGLSSLSLRAPITTPIDQILRARASISLASAASSNLSAAQIRLFGRMSTGSAASDIKQQSHGHGPSLFHSTALTDTLTPILPRHDYLHESGYSAMDIPVESSTMFTSSAISDGSAIAPRANKPRVSFGPTARLSFSSSYGGGASLGVASLTPEVGEKKTDAWNESRGTAVNSSGTMQPAKFQRGHGTDKEITESKGNYYQEWKVATNYRYDLPTPAAEPAMEAEKDFLSPSSSRRSTEEDLERTVPRRPPPSHMSPPKRERDLGEIEGIAPSSLTTIDEAAGEEDETQLWLKQRLITIYLQFIAALEKLCQYECQECIDYITTTFPEVHRHSGWAKYALGRCYFEMGDYKASVFAFKEMIHQEQHRTKGLEVFSTALWHLKRDKELSSLAQQVVEIDKFAPETWCVVGNCFSLQQETETALVYFQRALQVDPSFTYAHTLCGHEYVANEDLEKAIISFRNAIRCDDRHYNAWYGLGSVYYRQERFELAEFHFRKALELNPRSSILRCYVGMVLHSRNAMLLQQSAEGEDSVNNSGFSIERELEAHEILERAVEEDSKNPQLLFQWVQVLLSMDTVTSASEGLSLVLDAQGETEKEYLMKHPYLSKALDILHTLEEIAPKEPSVFSLLGQIYHQRLNDIKTAVQFYNHVLALDPKEMTTLKEVLASLESPEELDSL